MLFCTKKYVSVFLFSESLFLKCKGKVFDGFFCNFTPKLARIACKMNKKDSKDGR